MLCCPIVYDSVAVVYVVRSDCKLSGRSDINILRLAVHFNLDHSKICLLNSIYIVIQRSVLIYNSVLHFIENDNSVFIKCINSVIQQTVCFGYIVFTRFCSGQRASDIVIISVFVLNKTCCNRKSLGNIVSLVINLYKPLTLYLSSGFIKEIPNSLSAVASGFYMAKSCYHIPLIIEIVGLSVYIKESSMNSSSGPIITNAISGLYPCTLNKNSIIIKSVLVIFTAYLANTCQRIIIVTKIVIVSLNFSPTLH